MKSQQIRKVLQILRWEFGGYHPRWILTLVLLKLVPSGYGARLRAMIYRALGWSVGQKTLIMGTIALASPSNARNHLKIGSNCFINVNVFIDAGAQVSLGNGVAVGHHVVIITTNHEIGTLEYRAGKLMTSPVIIEDGAWIASGVTLLPGVRVGEGAVVAAGAVVTRNVPPNTLVGGVPAKTIRELDASHMLGSCLGDDVYMTCNR